MSGAEQALSASQRDLKLTIDTIPALPATAGLDPSAVGRGQALFTDPAVACSTCHTGALLTSNATVDVGTAVAIAMRHLG